MIPVCNTLSVFNETFSARVLINLMQHLVFSQIVFPFDFTNIFMGPVLKSSLPFSFTRLYELPRLLCSEKFSLICIHDFRAFPSTSLSAYFMFSRYSPLCSGLPPTFLFPSVPSRSLLPSHATCSVATQCSPPRHERSLFSP